MNSKPLPKSNEAPNENLELEEMNIDLLTYLEKFNSAILNELYEFPPTCLAVFRELPSLAQNFILRLMFIDQSIPQAVISSWVKSTR